MRWLQCLFVLSLLLCGATVRAGEPDVRLLTAKGEGKVQVTPDAARVHVAVEAEETTLAAARKNNERAMRRVLQQVAALKIPGLLMKSDEAQVSLIHESNPPQGKLARVIGYRIYTEITIRVNDAAPVSLSQKASRILDQALGAGANRLLGVTFLRLESRGAYNQALRMAIDDAKLNAAMIAQQAMVNLGRLRNLTPGWGSHYPDLSHGGGSGRGNYTNYTQMAHVGGGGGGTVVAAGAFLVKASVTAVFEIK